METTPTRAQLKGEILLYKTQEGTTGVKVKNGEDQEFLSLNQIANLFEINRTYTVKYLHM